MKKLNFMNFNKNNIKKERLNSEAKLEVKNVYVSYGKNTALSNISFTAEEGENIALIGPNGAGKSTLFKALVGLIHLDSGEILIHGLPAGYHIDCVAYVPQKEEIDWMFPLTVFDVVLMGRYSNLKMFSKPQKKDTEVVYNSLEQMGIKEIANEKISDLSGGQQQKVFIARAIAQEPHILLMDEPFTGIDISTKETIISFLNDCVKNKITVIVAIHDLNIAAKYFKKIILLNKNLIAYGKPSEVFIKDNLNKTFGDQIMYLNGMAFLDECCPPDENKIKKNI
jgi:ABC-type Mn2+/Zn2+ transport system ATPase subunit